MTNAEMEAEQLVEDLGLELPVIPANVCSLISGEGLKVEYREEAFDDSTICGLSLGHGEKVTVVVNANISNHGRKNFTGAHEIGHVVLHIQKNIQSSFTCSDGDLSTNTNNNSLYEKEANEFASCLLMPKSILERIIKRNDLSWGFIQRLAKDCETSLEATARRVIKLSKDSCALITHKKGETWTPVVSSSFQAYLHKIPFPQHLDDFQDDDHAIYPDVLEQCDTSDWIRNPKGLPLQISYQSIYNKKHDRRLTLIVVQDEVEGDEESDMPTFK